MGYGEMKKNPRIVEAYQVPGGNVSPDIFKLPCISSAMKLTSGNTIYRCSAAYVDGGLWAGKGNYICKLDSGKWDVFTSGEYQEYLSDE